MKNKLSLDYKDKVEGLKSEVVKAKASFESRLVDLKKQLSSAQNNSEALEELKIRHAKEMAEHVRESNQKYNSLYQEKLDQEDSLRAKFEKEKNKIVIDYEKRLKDLEDKVRGEEQKKHQRELVDVKAEMNVMLEEMRIKKQETEAKALKMKDSLEGKIADLDYTVDNKTGEISRLESRIDQSQLTSTCASTIKKYPK